jgi:hypothetical protein
MNPKIQNRNPVTARSLNMLMRGTNPFFPRQRAGLVPEGVRNISESDMAELFQMGIPV